MFHVCKYFNCNLYKSIKQILKMVDNKLQRILTSFVLQHKIGSEHIAACLARSSLTFVPTWQLSSNVFSSLQMFFQLDCVFIECSGENRREEYCVLSCCSRQTKMNYVVNCMGQFVRMDGYLILFHNSICKNFNDTKRRQFIIQNTFHVDIYPLWYNDRHPCGRSRRLEIVIQL